MRDDCRSVALPFTIGDTFSLVRLNTRNAKNQENLRTLRKRAISRTLQQSSKLGTLSISESLRFSFQQWASRPSYHVAQMQLLLGSVGRVITHRVLHLGSQRTDIPSTCACPSPQSQGLTLSRPLFVSYPRTSALIHT